MTESLCFIDSNIWLYRLLVDLVTTQQAEMRKRSLAIDLINTSNCAVSTQVVDEVCSVLTRKAKSSEPQIKQIIESFYDRCAVIELKSDTLFNASDLRDRYGFSFWDGLIVASALSANAEIFYSEDMQDGLIVEQRLTLINPFK